MRRYLSALKRRAAVVLRCGMLCAAAVTPILAHSIAVDLDPAKTKIEFTLGDVLHTVHGTFKLQSGHIELNPATKAISGLVRVDAASGESGSRTRDKRMTKDILEAAQYPEVTFTPTALAGELSSASSTATVTGWFAIHGQRHQLSVPVQVRIAGREVSASGKFQVPYIAWGMKNPSTFLLHVNEQVQIEVTAVGSIAGNP